MGDYKTGKDKKADYLRSLDRLIEAEPHMVYVVEDKHALRERARQMDVELNVGDAPPTGEAAPGQDDERWPHKYRKRYKAPSGNWVYVYDEPVGNKRTGFGKEPEKMPATGDMGKKRVQVSDRIENRAQQTGGKDRQKMFDYKQWMRDAMNVPGSTQANLVGAVKHLGKGDAAKGMAEFQARHKDLLEKNPHLKEPEDHGFAGEALARDIVGANQGTGEGENGRSKFSNRPGGFTPRDVNMRQPWQLTREEFRQRQEVDPKLDGGDYMKMLSQAAEAGNYIPNHVLGQGDEKDPEFTDAMHEFRDKYLAEQKPEMDISPETKEYVSKFERLTQKLPKKFDDWVKTEVRNEGNKYLIKGKASGFNIDSYDVTDAGIYSHMMTADDTIVMYHQYAEHVDHGRELLAQLHEHGIDCEYTVVKRASAVAWDNSWPDEAEMNYRETGEKDERGLPKRIGYSSDYILAFRPKDDKQAEELAALLHEHAHAGNENAHQAIHRSWYVPDVRSSKKLKDYGRAFLNIKTMGHQELCILTKNDFILEGQHQAPASPEDARMTDSAYDTSFRREYVYVDKSLHDVIKSMRSYGHFGRGEVLIVRL